MLLNYSVAALNYLKARLDADRGATAVEYGLIVALIAGVIIAVLVILGTQVYNAFCSVANGIGGTGTCTPKT